MKTEMYLTRSKRSNRLMLHFKLPECVNNNAWISDDRAIQLNDGEYDITFDESPVRLEFEKAFGTMGVKRHEAMWRAVEEEHGPLSQREAYVTLTAMEWADQTIIEKAVEWLQKEVADDYEGVVWGDMISDFRKAMEE